MLAASFVVLAAYGAIAAAAINPFCTPGSAAGQCTNPGGVAADTEDPGLVYVADRGNNRVDVFKADGTSVTSFGTAQLSNPARIAVDNGVASTSRHDVYVATDSPDFLVKKFKPLAANKYEYRETESFGKKGTGPCQFSANNPIAVGPGGTVYVANSYDKDGAGSGHLFVNRVIVFPSTGGGCLEEFTLFEGADETIGDLAVDSTGHVYVTIEGAGNVIRKYSAAGVFEAQLDQTSTRGLAVDSADNLFASQQGINAANSQLIYFFTKYDFSGSKVSRFGYVPSIASGFTLPLAVYENSAAEDTLYVSESSAGVRFMAAPPPTPAIVPKACGVKAGGLGNSKATLEAEINPEGKASNFWFEFLTQDKFDEEGGFENAQSSTKIALGGANDFELHQAVQKLEGLQPETVYHCRVVAENASGQSPPGEEGTFETKEGFEFGPTWTSNVSESSAAINVEGNPLELSASGQIEYVEDAKYQANEADRFADALSAPTPELEFGEGNVMVLQSVTLVGLKPGTLYHYRLRARNGTPAEGIVCPKHLPKCPELEHTFRTYTAGSGGFDQRGYELVSPGLKNSAEVAVPGNSAGFVEPRAIRIQAASGQGEAVTYTSWTSFGAGGGASGASQYLSKRTLAGWSTENISPFGYLSLPIFPPYNGFSPDLKFAAFKTTEPALTSDCRKTESIYLRDNETGILRCLDPDIPEGPASPCLVYAGASEDGSRVFLAGKPAGGTEYTYSLYEWTPTGVHLVSMLPPGESPTEAAAPATHGTAFGPGGSSFSGEEGCQVTRTALRNGISRDGTRAFWTYVPEASATLAQVAPGVQTLTIAGADGGSFTLTFQGQTTAAIAFDATAAKMQSALQALSTVGAGNVEVIGKGTFTITFKGALAGTSVPLSANGAELSDSATHLFVRVEGSTTLELDKAEKSSGGASGEGIFMAAGTDGSVAYFTDVNKLVSGASAKAGRPDLYRYELGKAKPLTDLTKGAVPGDVQGVVGASDDGSYVYFVAQAALTGGQEKNSAGQKAVAGQNNLYLYHDDQPTFIATLAPEDKGDWAAEPRQLSARVSPNGRHLAFLSIEAERLASYDNTILEGEHCQYGLTIESELQLTGSPKCSQAFLYDVKDADAGSLSCVSCNPAGTRPLGPTVVPGWTNGFEGPRILSDNGSRVFLSSFDALLPEDENGKLDVYEFERAGEGSCSQAAVTFDPMSGGCHFLVSGGKSSDESYLVDASSTGRDVFFSTRSRLVGWDQNDNFDVYDYREGGGFAEPIEPSVCTTPESCLPPPTAAPPPPSAATRAFTGPGNIKPHKNKKKHKKHAHKKKKHAKKRRVGR